MKFEHLRAFYKHVLDTPLAQVPSIYLILSADLSIRDWATRCLIHTFRLKGECVVVDPLHLLTPSLFDPHSFSILTQDSDIIERYQKILPPKKTLIISLPKLISTSKRYKGVAKEGVIFHLKALKPWEIESELVDLFTFIAEKEQIKVSPHILKSLAIRSGCDLLIMQTEWDKLVTYVGERQEIVDQDLAMIGPKDFSITLWQLTDALAARNGKDVFTLTAYLLQQKMTPIGIIRQLRSQWVILFEILTLLKNGKPLTQLTEALPYLKGRIFDQKVTTAQSYSYERIKKNLIELDAFEQLYKNGSKNDASFTDLIVAGLL
ncbi:hypothetical protein N9Y92_03195 [Chlamydiales bacterium]|nr:hypothetical protein [Chlamydiales bacterium]